MVTLWQTVLLAVFVGVITGVLTGVLTFTITLFIGKAPHFDRYWERYKIQHYPTTSKERMEEYATWFEGRKSLKVSDSAVKTVRKERKKLGYKD